MDRPRADQVIFTICSKNYLHFARALMSSVAATHPDWDRVVLLVDRIDGMFDPGREPFRVLEISELGIPRVEPFCFRYTTLELNTAAKPWTFERLLRQDGYRRAIYLDPDILVYRRMEEVEALFDDGAFCVLTPHLTAPLDDAGKPSEIEMLRAGAYNLGFLALQRHPELDEFLPWWQARLERQCVVEMENGLFVDQKWMDLVPGMHEHVSILRHEGYNVAYWNLPNRKVVPGPEGIRVNGAPLVFFHFSGIDPWKPDGFSKHQDRYRLSTLGAVRPLVESYCETLRAHGLSECARWPYAFARFDDGIAIPDVLRSYLRRHPELEDLAPGRNPFAAGADFFNVPFDDRLVGDPLVTRFVHAVWEDRPDLQAAFPDPAGRDREPLAAWFVQVRAIASEVDPAWVRPVEESFRRVHGPRFARAAIDPALARIRLAGKRHVPRPLKTWLRTLVRSPSGPGNPLQRGLRAALRMLPAALRRRIRALILPVGTTLPERPRFRPSPTVLRFGFHEHDDRIGELGRAWMGQEATIRIPRAEPGPVRVEGVYSPEPFLRAGGSARTTLEVAWNGQSVGRLVLDQEGAFQGTFDEPNGRATGPVTLSLRADQCFVPAQAGLGPDRRRLSVEIGRVDIGTRTVLDFSASARSDAPLSTATGLNIVGYLRSELGVGESARLAVTAADAAALPVALVDFHEGCSSRLGDDRFADRLGSSNPNPVNLLHINADQMPLAFSTLGTPFFEGKFNIGYWAWELPELPEEWLASFGLVDEVWVPSRFCQEAVGAQAPVPVIRMPHPMRVDLPDPPSRSDLELPEDRFLFLTMWDMHSFQERKNPGAVLEAYRLAFRGRRDVGLVVKTMNTGTYPEEWARFQDRIRDVDGVFVVDRVLSRTAVWGLESACDCFVSLHRSEGFGIGLAECMALGKPVIATGWSGNVDFTREDNSCLVKYDLVPLEKDHGPYRRGQVWADPDAEHAAHWMRTLVDDAAFRDRIGRAGRATVETELSPEAVGRRYVRRLEAIRRFRA